MTSDPVPITGGPSQIEQHRDACAASLGFGDRLPAMLEDRRRGGRRCSRQLAMIAAVMRRRTLRTGEPPSYPQIAEALGYATHSAAIAAVQRGRRIVSELEKGKA